jgi:hypothetical protein
MICAARGLSPSWATFEHAIGTEETGASDPEAPATGALDGTLAAGPQSNDPGIPQAYASMGGKWGATTLGTSGGQLTWSVAGAGWSNRTGSSAFFSGSTVLLSDVFTFDFLSIFRQAFDAWSTFANISFVQVADGGGDFGVGSTANIRIGAATIDGEYNTLAYAFGPPIGGYEHPAAGDIIFDREERVFWTAHSLLAVATHEIGHAIGLAHSTEFWSVMYPIYNPSITTPHADDIAGIRSIYGPSLVPKLLLGSNGHDFNGDGRGDLLLSRGSDLSIWQMNGTNVASNPLIGTMAAGWTFTATADFNGDAKSDLLLLNQNTSAVSIWQMNGTTVQSAPVVGSLAPGWGFVAARDFNGDANSDLLLFHPGTRQLSIWQMNGTSVQSASVVGALAPGWDIVAVDDFSGDSKSDMLFFNVGTRQLSIWQMDGPTVQSAPVVGTLAAGWNFAGTGDFNGDGKADLLFLNPNTLAVSIWLMNGTTIQSAPVVGARAPGWDFVSTEDFNADARSDLLFHNPGTGQLSIWQMNGATVDTAPVIGTHEAGWHLLA